MKVMALVFSALVLSSSAASAGELLITSDSGQAKSGIRGVGIDLATDGNVSGFNFFIRMENAKLGSIDLSKCLADLPKGWTGACNQTAEGVAFFAMASGKETLPAGIVSLGSLRLPADALAKQDSPLTVEHLVLADADGNAVTSSYQVAR